jgi:hypothetical protein
MVTGVSQLGERHRPIMLAARQRPHPLITPVSRDNPGERIPWQKIHQLGEKRLASSPAPPRKPSEKCQIEFKSTPPQIAKTAFKIMLLAAATPDLPDSNVLPYNLAVTTATPLTNLTISPAQSCDLLETQC